MPPRRGHPLVPSEHMSVGGPHRQQHAASGILEAAVSPYQSRVESHNDGCPPRVSRRNYEQGLRGSSQYSPQDEEDSSYVESGEEDTPRKPRKVRHQARKRKGQAKFRSKYAEKLDAIPGGPSYKRKCRGKVQGRPDALEYWDTKEEEWIPAVYHYKIRNKLINRAKTSTADSYRNPRARGESASDVTAFLESQRDWDLERDNGWTGVELLFMFADPEHERPSYEVSWLFDEGRVVLDLDNDPIRDYKDIPLTLSSEVEGALMEAIRRLDPRITHFDFWARLPKYCKGGEILTPGALNRRMGSFRLENAVVAWGKRLGSKTLRQFLWDRMSPAAQAANSTRELRKLSKEEQKQAQEGNAGKHAANAGGWVKVQNKTKQEVSVQAKQEEEGATVPAVSRSSRSRRPQRTSVSNNNGNEDTWSSFYAPEQGRQPRPKRRKVHETTTNSTYAPQNLYAEPTDEDALIDPSLRSQTRTHDNDHGHPFGPSSGMYGILPAEAAVGAFDAYPQSHLVSSEWSSSAGYGSVTQAMGNLARPFYHNQQTGQAVQRHMTHQPVGVGYTSNDTGVLANPWENGPHMSPTAQYQPVGVEDSSGPPLGASFAQDRSFFDDVEESFFRTNERTLPIQTRPTQVYPIREIDYRDVRPRGEEDRAEVQRALAMTRYNFCLRINDECPVTDTRQSYSYQVKHILDSFAIRWQNQGGPSPIPDLVRCQAPWRYDFAHWEAPTGGDQTLVNERYQEWRAAHDDQEYVNELFQE